MEIKITITKRDLILTLGVHFLLFILAPLVVFAGKGCGRLEDMIANATLLIFVYFITQPTFLIVSLFSIALIKKVFKMRDIYYNK